MTTRERGPGLIPREEVVLEYGVRLFEGFDLAQARAVLARCDTVDAAKGFLTELARVARGEKQGEGT